MPPPPKENARLWHLTKVGGRCDKDMKMRTICTTVTLRHSKISHWFRRATRFMGCHDTTMHTFICCHMDFENLPEYSYLYLAGDILFQIYSWIQLQSINIWHYTLIKNWLYINKINKSICSFHIYITVSHTYTFRMHQRFSLFKNKLIIWGLFDFFLFDFKA